MPEPPDHDPLPNDWHPVFAVWRWHWTVWLPMALLAVVIGGPVMVGISAGLYILLRDIVR
jgi:hypothetical protein